MVAQITQGLDVMGSGSVRGLRVFGRRPSTPRLHLHYEYCHVERLICFGRVSFDEYP
jgi:hypothetical protein